MSDKSTLLLFIFLLSAPPLAFAHGDKHAEENHSSSLMKDSSPLNDSIYAVSNGEDKEFPVFDDSLSPFSTTDILGEEGPPAGIAMGSGEPMIRFKEEINPKQKHGQHEKQKQHVEKATHEWVSPHSKGHGVAVGITIISGLAFAALSFFRIGEGNSKDSS